MADARRFGAALYMSSPSYILRTTFRYRDLSNTALAVYSLKMGRAWEVSINCFGICAGVALPFWR